GGVKRQGRARTGAAQCHMVFWHKKTASHASGRSSCLTKTAPSCTSQNGAEVCLYAAFSLQLRAGGNEGLASFVVLVLDEVLLEAGSKVLGLGLPLGGVGVGVARVEDLGVDAGQLGGHLE